MLVTSLAAGWVLRLWEMNHRVPLNLQGDAPLAEMLIKSLVDNGWYQHNTHLGAPLGQTLYDFPGFTGDHLQLVALKVMTLFTGSVGTIVNAYYLASFPVVALVAFLVLRRLPVSRPAALVCASLLQPAGLSLPAWRGPPVPIDVRSCSAGLPVSAARRPEPAAGPAGPAPAGVASAARRRTLKLVGVCVVIGMTGAYFAVFTILPCSRHMSCAGWPGTGGARLSPSW